MHQKRPVGRDAFPQPGNGGLIQPPAQRHNPAVELAVDHGAELHRQRGVATGQKLYLRGGHDAQGDIIVLCIGLIWIPASSSATRTACAVATAAGLSP